MGDYNEGSAGHLYEVKSEQGTLNPCFEYDGLTPGPAPSSYHAHRQLRKVRPSQPEWVAPDLFLSLINSRQGEEEIEVKERVRELELHLNPAHLMSPLFSTPLVVLLMIKLLKVHNQTHLGKNLTSSLC